jgi:hypothetical protein
VGIYLPSERAFILERYLAKRQRRLWAKTVRYSCRKSLADRRVRVNGRFVKADMAASIAHKPGAVPGAYVPQVARLAGMNGSGEGMAGGRGAPAGGPSSSRRRSRAASMAEEVVQTPWQRGRSRGSAARGGSAAPNVDASDASALRGRPRAGSIATVSSTGRRGKAAPGATPAPAAAKLEGPQPGGEAAVGGQATGLDSDDLFTPQRVTGRKRGRSNTVA